MQCPKCKTELQKEKSLRGVLWQCPQCQGVAANLAVLRKLLGQDVALKFWREARKSTPSNKPCPSGVHMLSVFTFPLDQSTLTLDLGKSCQILWFDKGELEAFPVEPMVLDDWTPEVKQKLAIAKVRQAALDSDPLMANAPQSRLAEVTYLIIRIIGLILQRA